MPLDDAPPADEFLPLVRPELPPPEELLPIYGEILASGMVTSDRQVREFERELAAALGVRHAVCLSSCTSGMMLFLRGLDLAGEVLLPSFTFMASAAAVVWAGLTPVFVAVDPETMVLDPAAVEAAISPRTCAILAVHLFGAPAPVERLAEIAGRHRLRLFYDAAHGLGTLRRGRPLGGFGDAASFSLSPTKLVVAAEGGVVTTNDDALAELVRQGRNYGNPGDYDCRFPGLSARMSEFHAALGRASLRRLEGAVARRNALAALYRERLGRLPGLSFQRLDAEDRSSCKEFILAVAAERFGLTRDELADGLRAAGVETRKYFDPPCHRMTAFRQFVRPHDDLERTARLAARTLALPLWSHLPPAAVERVCRTVEQLHARARRRGAVVH